MTELKEQLTVQPRIDYPQPIAESLWRLQDGRARTLNALKDLPAEAVDWQATGLHNTIGTLLYHIAAIELDWLYTEVLQRAWTPEIEDLFPYPVRDDNRHLYSVVNVSISEHLARLGKIRQCLLDGLSEITLEDYRQTREMPRYDVTPEWVLHHLSQHEAEHRGEILTIRTLYNASQNSA